MALGSSQAVMFRSVRAKADIWTFSGGFRFQVNASRARTHRFFPWKICQSATNMHYRYDIQADMCVADLLQIVGNVADSWQIWGKVSGIRPVHRQSPIQLPHVASSFLTGDKLISHRWENLISLTIFHLPFKHLPFTICIWEMWRCRNERMKYNLTWIRRKIKIIMEINVQLHGNYKLK